MLAPSWFNSCAPEFVPISHYRDKTRVHTFYFLTIMHMPTHKPRPMTYMYPQKMATIMELNWIVFAFVFSVVVFGLTIFNEGANLTYTDPKLLYMLRCFKLFFSWCIRGVALIYIHTKVNMHVLVQLFWLFYWECHWSKYCNATGKITKLYVDLREESVVLLFGMMIFIEIAPVVLLHYSYNTISNIH